MRFQPALLFVIFLMIDFPIVRCVGQNSQPPFQKSPPIQPGNAAIEVDSYPHSAITTLVVPVVNTSEVRHDYTITSIGGHVKPIVPAKHRGYLLHIPPYSTRYFVLRYRTNDLCERAKARLAGLGVINFATINLESSDVNVRVAKVRIRVRNRKPIWWQFENLANEFLELYNRSLCDIRQVRSCFYHFQDALARITKGWSGGG